MPFRKRFPPRRFGRKRRPRRTFRRRVVRRRRTRRPVMSNRPISQLSSNIIGKPLFPKRIVVRMMYAEPQIGSINPGAAGVAASYVFRANSIYDPNFTGTGHQPMGFDQMMTMYQNFVVLGSKITCTFNNSDTTNHVIVGIYLSSNSTVISDLSNLIENGNCVFSNLSDSDTSNSVVTLTKMHSPKKWFGVRNIVDDDLFQGTSSADATNLSFYHCFAAANSASDPGSVGLSVRIEYIVMFKEPVNLSSS